jgi:A/G-specific adenine glycosylase
LLDWFAANARDLPWRRTRDPYAIWVSEIMLQQTQVKTVIPYWELWMRKLPTIESLAHANADKIHKLWEGLGYYTRVRNMQKAAQQIIASQSAVAADVSPLRLKAGKSQSRLTSAATVQGRKPRKIPTTRSPCNGERAGARGFPTNFDTVLALPGIGRYTAGAICSIAFNQPTPILDGNVIRVLTRIHGIATDPREKQTNAKLWQLAEELVTHAKMLRTIGNTSWTAAGSEAPRRFGRLTRPPKGLSPLRSATALQNSCSHLNQSLMELGALVCTPRSPNCAACPVQKLCVAQKENLQDQLPNLGKREAATERRFLAFVIERRGKFLVRQRPAGVVNAHLWEFPNVETNGEANLARAFENVFKAKPASLEKLCTVKHSITRYRITLEAWRAMKGRLSAATAGRWLALKQLRQLAFTSAHKKILAGLNSTQYDRPRR